MGYAERKRRRQQNKDDLRGAGSMRLCPAPLPGTYDGFAVVARTALIFCIVYGTMGGFLSAYGIDYSRGICIGVISLTALILTAAYETRKKWVMNLSAAAVFFVYLAVVFLSYWTINSGYYAILNIVLEASRTYLGVAEGMEYALVVEENYRTITVFSAFIGAIGVILLNFRVYRKVSLPGIVLFTLPLYLIPLFFGKAPRTGYGIILFAGYAAAGILQAGGVKGHLSSQVKYVFAGALLFVTLFMTVLGVVLPQGTYMRIAGENPLKERLEEQTVNLVRFGAAALFSGSRSGAGMSGGRLGWGASPIPDYEADLIVRFAPYSFETVYLKAFTGIDYEGSRWVEDEEDSDSVRLRPEASYRREAYLADAEGLGRGVMSVENVGADTKYDYYPYYTESVEKENNAWVCTYYPDLSTPSGAPGAAMEPEERARYLDVPARCARAVEAVCQDAAFLGEPEEIAAQMRAYFDENYRYTLRPGLHFGSSDYISYFLLENKKGYCMHFASAATMLFREMGIPARYVEGYAFSYTELLADGVLEDEERYEEYYSGYSPLGETGVVRLEVPDADAHAWTEIYVDGKGWIAVDMTPAYSGEDETSFWDAFGNWGMDGEFSPGGTDLGRYLELISGGAVFVITGGAAALLLFWLARRLYRSFWDSRLPERERAKKKYREWVRRAEKKDPEFCELRTIRQQLEWAAKRADGEVDEELAGRLYELFYAPETSAASYDGLRKEIERLKL